MKPQLFRAFSCVYVLLMPFMYGPYYALSLPKINHLQQTKNI